MQRYESEDGSETASGEELLALEFFQLLSRSVAYSERVPVADPLEQTVQRIRDNPAFLQSRLLRRILAALTTGQGTFHRAEAAALDAPTLALVLSLVEERGAQRRPQFEWLEAAEEADEGPS